MALCKYSTNPHQSSSDEFDKTYEPGNRSSWSGIYRCLVCEADETDACCYPSHIRFPTNYFSTDSWSGSICVADGAAFTAGVSPAFREKCCTIFHAPPIFSITIRYWPR